MNFLERIQKDLNWDKFQKEVAKFQKDIKKNIEDGLSMVKDGGTAVTQRIERLTEEGKNKYKSFNLNMKVQEEFAKLGGQVYDLINKKSKNPLSNRKVISIVNKINKLEKQITKLDTKKAMKAKPVKKKSTKKKSTRKKTTT